MARPDPQLSEHLRRRLEHALGRPSGEAVPQRAQPARRAATGPVRTARVDESLIQTVLRAPDADLPDAVGAAAPEVVGDVPGTRARPVTPVPRFDRRHLWVVVAVLTVAVVIAGWMLLRARDEAIGATPRPSAPSVSGPSVSEPSVSGRPGTAGPSGGATGGPGISPSPAMIKVHVTGAVREPGVVTVAEGARVGDVIDRAGGLTEAARPGRLNLAQLVADGDQVFVADEPGEESEVRAGSAGGGGAGGGGAGGGPGGATTAKVDLNTATLAQLEALPGVGPVTAQAIMSWREEHGRFSRIEELQEIDGIGPKTYARIAPHVRV
ncbi:helix-hairpin-helix domain-containing protein [Propionibacteriaceae bacterium Y2011]